MTGGARVRLSSLDRRIWNDPVFTKGEIAAYYRAVADAFLPHLSDRPVTLARFPEGIDAYGWYQTNCRQHPDWIPTRRVGTQDYCRIENVDALLWAVNVGTVEFHPLFARGERTDVAAAVVFDLDPGEPAAFRESCAVALLVRRELEGRGLASFPKASGSLGVHVVVPLNGTQSYAETKPFARVLAQRLADEHPELVVDRPSRALREGKVLVDWAQNDEAKSLVAPYSLRATTVPAVSSPLAWDEVEAVAAGGGPVALAPADALARLDRLGDLFADVTSLRQAVPRP